MAIDFLPPLAAVHEPVASAWRSAADGPAGAAPPATFASLVSAGLRGVSERLQASERDLQHLAAGDAGNLHDVMIRLEQSRLSLQLLLQVRNRLLESYQDVMRMQV
jgi:flagellar hook-basal body complex protein FliE